MEKVRIRIAWNDLSTRGNGERVVARIVHDNHAYWPDQCPVAEDVTTPPPKPNGSSCYELAKVRHAEQYATLPVGTIVVLYRMRVERYRASRAHLQVFEVTANGLQPTTKAKAVRRADGDWLSIDGGIDIRL